MGRSLNVQEMNTTTSSFVCPICEAQNRDGAAIRLTPACGSTLWSSIKVTMGLAWYRLRTFRDKKTLNG